MAERLLQDKEGEGDKKRKRNKKGALGVQKYDNKDKDGTLCFFSLNVYVCVCVCLLICHALQPFLSTHDVSIAHTVLFCTFFASFRHRRRASVTKRHLCLLLQS